MECRMFKRFLSLIFCGILSVSCCGCFALMAGAAGGAGTAVWLSGKLSQEENVSFEKAISGSKKALNAFAFEVDKETVKGDAAQIMSSYSDGRTIWIDIHRVSVSSCRIEVRVGMSGDKDAAAEILKKIEKYL
jgi:hypothetical protein